VSKTICHFVEERDPAKKLRRTLPCRDAVPPFRNARLQWSIDYLVMRVHGWWADARVLVLPGFSEQIRWDVRRPVTSLLVLSSFRLLSPPLGVPAYARTVARKPLDKKSWEERPPRGFRTRMSSPPQALGVPPGDRAFAARKSRRSRIPS
jgi:hypothetical protein